MLACRLVCATGRLTRVVARARTCRHRVPGDVADPASHRVLAQVFNLDRHRTCLAQETETVKPIRIAHISDTHLGYRALGKTDPVTGRNQRSIDVEQRVRSCDHRHPETRCRSRRSLRRSFQPDPPAVRRHRRGHAPVPAARGGRHPDRRYWREPRHPPAPFVRICLLAPQTRGARDVSSPVATRPRSSRFPSSI